MESRMGFENLIYDQETPSDNGFSCNSILTGIVKNNWNKDYPGQVQVELLMGGDKGKTTLQWVRVMQPYCGNEYGDFFIPEIDTEVVIGFVGGDISSPVVLGCLWNKKDKLPAGKANDKNSVKSIRTKSGHEILFDETKDKEKIEIKTKGELDICLLDKDKKIVIKDASGKNAIEVDADKGMITLEADKKIVLKAGGNEMLALDGAGKKAVLKAGAIEVTADQTLKLQGKTLNVEGNMLQLKAQGSMKAQSGGVLEIKGAMTKIN